MRVFVEEIVDHPAVAYDHSMPFSAETLGDNEALDALRQLRRIRECANPGGKFAVRLASYCALPRDCEEREMLLTAYGRRTLCLPPDLALLVQDFVEQDSYEGRLRRATDPPWERSVPSAPWNPDDPDLPWFLRKFAR